MEELPKDLGVFDWRPKLMAKVSHVTVSLATVWFTVTSMARQTFLAPYLTCHRLIFVPNLATSVALILLATFSMAATLCRRLGAASFGRQPNRPLEPFGIAQLHW
jgi:hypothetical protein